MSRTMEAGKGLSDSGASVPISWGVGAYAFQACLPPALHPPAKLLFAAWQPASDALLLGEWEVRGEEESWVISSRNEDLIRTKSAPFVLAYLETSGMRALSLAETGLAGLHAALVNGPHGAVAIVGRCTSGKSTLACSMGLTEGWALLSDDSVLVDRAADGNWRAVAGPRRVSVRSTSRDLLGEAFWEAVHRTPSLYPTQEGFLFSPSELWPASRKREAELKAIFLLERQDSVLAPGECARMPAAQGVVALAPYTYACARSGFGAAIKELGPVLDKVPLFEMKRGDLGRMRQNIRQKLELLS